MKYFIIWVIHIIFIKLTFKYSLETCHSFLTPHEWRKRTLFSCLENKDSDIYDECISGKLDNIVIHNCLYPIVHKFSHGEMIGNDHVFKRTTVKSNDVQLLTFLSESNDKNLSNTNCKLDMELPYSGTRNMSFNSIGVKSQVATNNYLKSEIEEQMCEPKFKSIPTVSRTGNKLNRSYAYHLQIPVQQYNKVNSNVLQNIPINAMCAKELNHNLYVNVDVDYLIANQGEEILPVYSSFNKLDKPKVSPHEQSKSINVKLLPKKNNKKLRNMDNCKCTDLVKELCLLNNITNATHLLSYKQPYQPQKETRSDKHDCIQLTPNNSCSCDNSICHKYTNSINGTNQSDLHKCNITYDNRYKNTSLKTIIGDLNQWVSEASTLDKLIEELSQINKLFHAIQEIRSGSLEIPEKTKEKVWKSPKSNQIRQNCRLHSVNKDRSLEERCRKKCYYLDRRVRPNSNNAKPRSLKRFPTQLYFENHYMGNLFHRPATLMRNYKVNQNYDSNFPILTPHSKVADLNWISQPCVVIKPPKESNLKQINVGHINSLRLKALQKRQNGVSTSNFRFYDHSKCNSMLESNHICQFGSKKCVPNIQTPSAAELELIHKNKNVYDCRFPSYSSKPIRAQNLYAEEHNELSSAGSHLYDKRNAVNIDFFKHKYQSPFPPIQPSVLLAKTKSKTSKQSKEKAIEVKNTNTKLQSLASAILIRAVVKPKETYMESTTKMDQTESTHIILLPPINYIQIELPTSKELVESTLFSNNTLERNNRYTENQCLTEANEILQKNVSRIENKCTETKYLTEANKVSLTSASRIEEYDKRQPKTINGSMEKDNLLNDKRTETTYLLKAKETCDITIKPVNIITTNMRSSGIEKCNDLSLKIEMQTENLQIELPTSKELVENTLFSNNTLERNNKCTETQCLTEANKILLQKITSQIENKCTETKCPTEANKVLIKSAGRIEEYDKRQPKTVNGLMEKYNLLKEHIRTANSYTFNAKEACDITIKPVHVIKTDMRGSGIEKCNDLSLKIKIQTESFEHNKPDTLNATIKVNETTTRKLSSQSPNIYEVGLYETRFLCEEVTKKQCRCDIRQMISKFQRLLDSNITQVDVDGVTCGYTSLPVSYNLTSVVKPKVQDNTVQPIEEEMPIDIKSLTNLSNYSKNGQRKNCSTEASRVNFRIWQAIASMVTDHFTSDTTLVFPGRNVVLPCTNGLELARPANRSNFNWTHNNAAAVTDGRITEAGGMLYIKEAALSDGGRYNCSVTYPCTDAGANFVKTFSHRVAVVVLPNMSLHAKVRYNSSVKCEVSLLNTLELNMPLQVQALLCNLTGYPRICTVAIQKPICQPGGAMDEVSVNYVVSLTDLTTVIYSSSNQSACGPLCYQNISTKVILMLKESLVASLSLPGQLDRDVSPDTSPTIPAPLIASTVILPNGTELTPIKNTLEVSYVVTCRGGCQFRSAFCEPCEVNWYSKDGSTNCKQCPKGQYQPKRGSIGCLIFTDPLQPGYCFAHSPFESYKTTVAIVLAPFLIVLCSTCILICFSKNIHGV